MAHAVAQPKKAGRKGISPEMRDRVIQTYQYEVKERGERGVYGRVASRYRKPDGKPYSDEWARQIIIAWKEETKAQIAAIPEPEPADTLSYIPPPGAAAFEAQQAMARWRFQVAQRKREQDATRFMATFNANIDRLMIGLTAIDREIERQQITEGVDAELLAHLRYVNQQAKELANKRWNEYEYQIFRRDAVPPLPLPTHQLSLGSWLLLVGMVLVIVTMVVSYAWGYGYGVGTGGVTVGVFWLASVVCRWERTRLIE